MAILKKFSIILVGMVVCGMLGLMHPRESSAVGSILSPLIIELAFDRNLANVNHGEGALSPPLHY